MLLALGSVGVFWDRFGALGAVGAVVWGAVGAYAVEFAATRLNFRQACQGAATLGVAAVIAFAVVYPRADVSSGYRGTDRDDDADIAVHAAFDGEYPFSPRTYLGNDVTHLPGSLLIAAPFVAAGGAALLNLAVVPLGVVLLARRTRSARAVVIAVGGGAACASVWHEWLTGGTFLAEMILIVMAAVWAAERAGPWRAALLGVAVNARANTVTALASAVGALSRRDWRGALGVGGIAGGVQVLLVAPFLVGGYDRFTPLSSARPKFEHLAGLFAAAPTIVPVAVTLLGAVVAFVVAQRRPDAAGVAAAVGASQLVPFALLASLSALAGNSAWAESWLRYLLLGVVPGLAALALFSANPAAAPAASARPR